MFQICILLQKPKHVYQLKVYVDISIADMMNAINDIIVWKGIVEEARATRNPNC